MANEGSRVSDLPNIAGDSPVSNRLHLKSQAGALNTTKLQTILIWKFWNLKFEIIWNAERYTVRGTARTDSTACYFPYFYWLYTILNALFPTLYWRRQNLLRQIVETRHVWKHSV